uniref:Putative c2h2-type zn-finger protein n=2 Tax=Ixodes ricinus TaxID=34613 RepID=A0A147BDL9_IXORI
MSEAAGDLPESPDAACPAAPWLPANGCLEMPSLCYQSGPPFDQGYHHPDDLGALADAMEPLSSHHHHHHHHALSSSSSDPYGSALADHGREGSLRLPPVSTIMQAAKESFELPQEPALADGRPPQRHRHGLLDAEQTHFLAAQPSDAANPLLHGAPLGPGDLLDSPGLAEVSQQRDAGEHSGGDRPGNGVGSASAQAMLSLAEQWARDAGAPSALRRPSPTSSAAEDSSPMAARDGLLSEGSLSPQSSGEAPPALLPVIPSLFSLSGGLQPLPPLLLSSVLPSTLAQLRPDEAPASSGPSHVRIKQEPSEDEAPRGGAKATRRGGDGSAPLPSGDPAKPFQCGLCGKHLASKNVHQLHMRSHSGEKPFTCALCGHRFSQKTSLTRHMRSHTGERPFPCEVCGKRFADKERIKIHMRTHTGEKPFACEVCGKTFSQKSTVKRHMSVHTGEKPFKCPVCAKGFANRGNLNAHAKTHAHS